MKLLFNHYPVLLFCFLTALILTNCHSPGRISKETNKFKSSGENFDKFYDKFHTDSIFQVSRTKFPLGGMSVEGDKQKRWTKENLPLMKIRVYDVDTTRYKVSFKKTTNTFTQKVWLENSGFISECRFELIGRKWYLVYVLDQDL